jgi:hypothetical protein
MILKPDWGSDWNWIRIKKFNFLSPAFLVFVNLEAYVASFSPCEYSSRFRMLDIFCDEPNFQFCFRTRAINLLWTTILPKNSILTLQPFFNLYRVITHYHTLSDLARWPTFCPVRRPMSVVSIFWLCTSHQDETKFIHSLNASLTAGSQEPLSHVGGVCLLRSGVHAPVRGSGLVRGEGKHWLFWLSSVFVSRVNVAHRFFGQISGWCSRWMIHAIGFHVVGVCRVRM